VGEDFAPCWGIGEHFLFVCLYVGVSVCPRALEFLSSAGFLQRPRVVHAETNSTSAVFPRHLSPFLWLSQGIPIPVQTSSLHITARYRRRDKAHIQSDSTGDCRILYREKYINPTWAPPDWGRSLMSTIAQKNSNWCSRTSARMRIVFLELLVFITRIELGSVHAL